MHAVVDTGPDDGDEGERSSFEVYGDFDHAWFRFVGGEEYSADFCILRSTFFVRVRALQMNDSDLNG